MEVRYLIMEIAIHGLHEQSKLDHMRMLHRENVCGR